MLQQLQPDWHLILDRLPQFSIGSTQGVPGSSRVLTDDDVATLLEAPPNGSSTEIRMSTHDLEVFGVLDEVCSFADIRDALVLTVKMLKHLALSQDVVHMAKEIIPGGPSDCDTDSFIFGLDIRINN